MTGITFTRDSIFGGWTEGEDSRIVGRIDEASEFNEQQSEKLRHLIAQHHTSEMQEPYFYSVRKVCPVDIARDNFRSKKIKLLILIAILCIGISLIVFFNTRSFFENEWKLCQEIADKREYVIRKAYHLFGFDRYATAQDIWDRHPTAGAPFLLFFRNAFCFLFPFAGLIGCSALNQEPFERRYFNLIIDRSKDKRVCPSNFDIQEDCDPLTQEEITIQKLHSPQMIYLPNYAVEAKSFVKALLIAGKKDFSDPIYGRKFNNDEREKILSQIERIFLISEKSFDECFEKEDTLELFLDIIDRNRYLRDERIFNESGSFSNEARSSLQEVLGESDTNSLILEIESMPDEHRKRFMVINALQSTGCINSLKKDDKASWRMKLFEMSTGVSL